MTMGVAHRILLLGLFYLRSHCLEDIGAVLDEVAFQVQEIAKQATENAENACDSLPECTAENCLRRACQPQSKDEIQSLSCITGARNLDCVTADNGTCPSLSVSTDRSYIRLPMTLENDTETKISLCAQKRLDQTLLHVSQSSSKFSKGSVLFGGVEGFLFLHPGRDFTDEAQCSQYDPRKRPWYIHALAVVKSLYILLDTSPSMSNDISPLSSQSRLQVGKKLISEILYTLTNGDQVAVSRLSGAAPIGKTVLVSMEGIESSFTHPEIAALNDAESNVKVDTSQPDLKQAFLGALDFFRPISNLKVLLVVTDGQFANHVNLTDLDPVFKELNEQNVVIFVYRIGFDTSNDRVFQTIQGKLNMSFEAVKDETNLQMKLHSYFSFLAWLRFIHVNKKAVWVPLYVDSSTGGNVTSAIFPAFDANQRFLGVACIDIVADDLINSFGLPLVQEAVSKRSSGPSQELTPALLAQPVPKSTSCDFAGKMTPICPRRDFSTPMTSFICCGSCSATATATASSSSRKSFGIGGACGVVVGSVVTLAVAVGIAMYFVCRTRLQAANVEEQAVDDWIVPSGILKAGSAS